MSRRGISTDGDSTGPPMKKARIQENSPPSFTIVAASRATEESDEDDEEISDQPPEEHKASDLYLDTVSLQALFSPSFQRISWRTVVQLPCVGQSSSPRLRLRETVFNLSVQYQYLWMLGVWEVLPRARS